MKDHSRRIIFIRLGLIIILIGILVATIGCGFRISPYEPLFDLVIENQTDQVLAIYLDLGIDSVGEIHPGEQIRVKDMDSNSGEYLIKAKNSQGETVFSGVYAFKTNLQEIDEDTWKAVIPPLQNVSGSSDNVTGS